MAHPYECLSLLYTRLSDTTGLFRPLVLLYSPPQLVQPRREGKMPKTDDKKTLYCSFCGKSQNEVKKIIAGPTVFICDECVALCLGILYEENKELPEDIAQFARSQQRTEAIGVMTRIVKRLLDEEEKRHAPYVKLQKALTEWEDAAEPPREPTSIV